MKLTMLLIKVVHLIQYSNKKTNFRKIKLILDLENWSWKLKNAVFWQPSIKRFYKVSKNPLRMFIWMQKSIELHLPHYEIPQLSSHYSTPSVAHKVKCVIKLRAPVTHVVTFWGLLLQWAKAATNFIKLV